MSLNARRTQLTYGWELVGDHQPLTGLVVSGNDLTSLSGLTDQKYEDQWLIALTGANDRRAYKIVTNDTTSISLQEAASGFVAADRVAFTLRNKRPTVTSRWLASEDEQTMPEMKRTLAEKHYHGLGIEVAQTYDMQRVYESGGLTFDYQISDLLLGILGGCAQTGTDTGGGGGSTLSDDHAAGEQQVRIVAGTDYADTDFIQVGSGSTAEVRQITSGGGTTTMEVDAPFLFDHDSGVVCNEVEAPFTKTFSAYNDDRKISPPTLALERVFDESNDIVQHFLGHHMQSLEFSGTMDKHLVMRPGITGMSQLLNDTSKSAFTEIDLEPFKRSMISGGITYDSVVYANFEDWTLTIDRPVEMKSFHTDSNGLNPNQGYREGLKYRLIGTVAVENANFISLVEAGTEFTASIPYVRTVATDTTTFTATRATLEVAKHPTPKTGAVMVSAEGPLESLQVVDVNSFAHPWLQAS